MYVNWMEGVRDVMKGVLGLKNSWCNFDKGDWLSVDEWFVCVGWLDVLFVFNWI